MSDDWIVLIPEDPRYVPSLERQELARERFAEIAPEADEVTIHVTENIEFVHCGGNFERVVCPSCLAEVPNRWWQDTVTEDYAAGFKLLQYTMPCCNKRHTLDDLVYEWPQGFGRFALEARNPNLGLLDDRYRTEFEEILGTSLRVIYRHM